MRKWSSILGYLLMVAGLLGLLFTHNLLSTSALVLVPQTAAVALMLWARITFGRRSFHLAANPTAGALVTTGPYRLIRHPIYAAVCLFVLPGAAAHASWAALGLGGVVVAGALIRIFSEEALLLGRYPEYRAYARRTWRLLPPVF
jgi:protein-S-isoprenylcysteine O-methyltransferase Ste14